jgi:hypothetical protein
MELEHLFQQSNHYMSIQMALAVALLFPGALGRVDIYRAFVREAASMVVTVGPVGLLVYVLYEMAKLS